jgi:histidinol-phosphate aminotransferase
LSAIQDAFGEVNRYPFQTAPHLVDAIAASLEVDASNVSLGCGSSEILDVAALGFTAPDRGLVTALPTFELLGDVVRHMNRPVVEVPVTSTLELDLEQTADRATGAGLIYICNPNNPTGTLHGAKAMETFIDAALRREPRVTILIDEAYHEYVERSDYASAVPIAVSNPRVVVSRTFSKVYGLAGMRIGYAVGQRQTLQAMDKYLDSLRISRLSLAAAISALGDSTRVAEQRTLNHDARAFTTGVFREAGYQPVASEANFLIVDVRRDIRQFQAACHERGVDIARPFPPLLSYARITIGTMDEMTQAAAAFREALAQTPSAAHLGPNVPLPFRRGAERVC